MLQLYKSIIKFTMSQMMEYHLLFNYFSIIYKLIAELRLLERNWIVNYYFIKLFIEFISGLILTIAEKLWKYIKFYLL